MSKRLSYKDHFGSVEESTVIALELDDSERMLKK